MKGVPVKTDGLNVYHFVGQEYRHHRVVLTRKKNAAELFPKVHMIVSNLNMWLRGTYHALPRK